MSETPELLTERLELWQPRAGDVAQMIAIVSDPQTGRYLGANPSYSDHFTRFQRNAGSWHLFGYGGFMVRLRGQPEVIGNCGVFHSYRGLGDDFDDMPEAGWIISAVHVGKGIAGEAMHAALEWFDANHGPRRMVCMIHPDNAPSLALAGKLGFRELRRTTLADGDAIVLLAREP